MITLNAHRFFRKLQGFSLPRQAPEPWILRLKNGVEVQAALMNSTRITGQVILLHFQAQNPRMRLYQIILPRMIGTDHFHDLLVYLKTH